MVFRIALGRHGIVAVFYAAALCVAASSNAAADPGPGKPLSKPEIRIIGANAQSFSEVWIAQDKGFFAQQGLKVTTTLSKQSASTWITVMLSGSADFVQGASAAEVLAAQNGAPVKAVLMDTAPSGQLLDVSQKFATAHNLPPEAKTSDQAIAQLKALKGSHINIGVEGSTADAYAWLLYMFREAGLTVGPNGDARFTFTGSPLNNVAALRTGSVDAIASALPYANQPDTVRVPLFMVPPATDAAGQYMITMTSMIQQHPDTVQAVVNAITQASLFVKQHQAEAFAIAQPHLVEAGYADPDLQHLMFDYGYAQFVQLSYPTKLAYDKELLLVNEGAKANGKPPLDLPWEKFADTSFAEKALQAMNLPIPVNK